MTKSDFCQHLIDDIKDEVDFDSDVEALAALLVILLEYNVKKSFDNWKYLVLKYDFDSLNKDIDFIPLKKDYPEKLIQKVGIESFFNYMKDIPTSKAIMIYNAIFNIYCSDCFIYQSLNYYIKMNDNNSEVVLIKNILDKSKLVSKMFFDKTEFIKRIILLHVKNERIPIDFLQDLINSIENKKDRAVLNALLIDYLVF